MKRTQTTAAAAAAATIAFGLAACASSPHHATTTAHHTQMPAPAAAPTLTGPQAQWVSDARAQFGFNGDTDASVLQIAQDVCADRSSGDSQSATIRLVGSELTSASGTSAVVRLAEKDLCPAQVPVPHWHVLATYSGSGQWNSPPFKLHNGSHLRVVFSYYGNTLGGSASNFIADLVSSADDLQIANDIAAAGGKRISLYPDLSFGGTKWYHLEVQADGNWSFKIEQKY